LFWIYNKKISRIFINLYIFSFLVVCGEAYNKCQLNDGAGNCKSLVDVSPVTKCFNENSACQIMEAGASYS
jgi:hypothetical protein